MIQSGLYLVLGFFIGALVCSLVSINIAKSEKKKQSISFEQRNQLIRSIAEMFTEIDTLVISLRSGLIKDDGFRDAIYSKLDSINKTYKPNMHILDIYHVKYIDAQIDKYSTMALKKVAGVNLDGKTAFENECLLVEEGRHITKSSEPTSIPVDDSIMFIPDDNLSDKSEPSSIEEAEPVLIVNDVPAENISEEIITDEEIFKEEKPEADSQLPGLNNKEECEELQKFSFTEMKKPDEEKAVLTEQFSDSENNLPLVEDSLSEENNTVLISDMMDSEENIDSADADDEISFEIKPQISDKLKAASIAETTIELSKSEPVISESKPAVVDPFKPGVLSSGLDNKKSEFQKEFEQVAKEPEEEDLIETIMDLDMSKILRAGSINIEKKGNITTESSKNVPIANVSPNNSSVNSQFDDNQKTNKSLLESKYRKDNAAKLVKAENDAIKEQEKIVIARGDEGGADTILQETPSEIEIHSKATDDIKDVAITGDDVASKIDSFFGIK